MNFFQSVFSDDPEPESESESESKSKSKSDDPNPNIQSITSAWTFGNTLLQTLAAKSESVIETYRRDLQEFTSGIKSETAVIRQAAVNAVKDLPNSLEAGADLAHGSLESVGQAIDDLGLTVTSLLSVNDIYSVNNDNNNINRGDSDTISISDNLGFPKAYSRLDAQIRGIRSNMKTYLEEPEDVEEFNEWKLGFIVDENVGEIEDVMKADGGVVGELFREIVPVKVDEETFWRRYFYKVYKAKKAEEARVKLMNRAVLGEQEEEELSWDVDEDEYKENAESDLKVEEKEAGESREKDVKEVAKEENVKDGDKDEVGGDNVEVKSDVKTGLEGKTDRDSDISIVSSQPSPEEDGWDEIEDIGSSDENKENAVASHGSPDRAELRKRLSVAEDDEELTWDIEDDDEPVKT